VNVVDIFSHHIFYSELTQLRYWQWTRPYHQAVRRDHCW